MTLPFRRRHHDGESGHDRARMLLSDGLLGPIDADDAAWLARHLEGCAECRRDEAAFAADRALLRTLRDAPPAPPRDLWAKTSAALDREARRRGTGSPAAAMDPRRSGWRAIPLGAAVSTLVLAVLVGSRLVEIGPQPLATSPSGSGVAQVPPTVGPTPIQVDTEPLVVFRETVNGSWELVRQKVKQVCKASKPRCAPKPEEQVQSIDLGNRPKKITMSPTDNHLVIASSSENGGDGAVLVVPVEPGGSPLPTVLVTLPPPTDTPAPAGSPGSPTPTPAATPPGAIAIATGVTVVGDVAYSDDGRWLAFSAAPSDESTGPDLYLWSVGDPTATVVTDDHQTYFSSWHEGQVLASRVEVAGPAAGPDASGESATSGAPSPSAEPTRKPDRGNGNGNGNGGGGKGAEASPSPTPAESAGATASGEPDASATPAAPFEGRAISFLLDPATHDRRDLTSADVWLPVLGPSGRFVVYWSGTLVSDNGWDWALGDGELVLDRWVGLPDTKGGEAPDESPAGELGEPEGSGAPAPTATPLGPAGEPTPLVEGPKATFEASFDPDGQRLAIWVGEDLDEAVGRLHLLVLDRETGAISDDSPLQGAPALRRFSIDKGRLAWVTPSGQDGQASVVQVLGWTDDDFGEIETQSGTDLYIAP